jgi:hypothetical protein
MMGSKKYVGIIEVVHSSMLEESSQLHRKDSEKSAGRRPTGSSSPIVLEREVRVGFSNIVEESAGIQALRDFHDLPFSLLSCDI